MKIGNILRGINIVSYLNYVNCILRLTWSKPRRDGEWRPPSLNYGGQLSDGDVPTESGSLLQIRSKFSPRMTEDLLSVLFLYVHMMSWSTSHFTKLAIIKSVIKNLFLEKKSVSGVSSCSLYVFIAEAAVLSECVSDKHFCESCHFTYCYRFCFSYNKNKCRYVSFFFFFYNKLLQKLQISDWFFDYNGKNKISLFNIIT